MSKAFKFYCLIFFVIKVNLSYSQVTPPPAPDTVRTIQILKGGSLRKIMVDSVTELQTIAIGVLLQEGTTKFSSDSAVLNRRLNTIEAFGNIHINQADSIHTYSQYLKYLGNERMAYLKKNVKLTDKKGTLFTEDLEYDLKTSIGKYHNGGKVINGNTTLTSKEGVYYGDTKDVYFKGDVYLADPKYKIKADSMIYNMHTEVATFTGPTHIKSKDGEVYTTQGTYDLKSGNAFFGERSIIKDSSGRTLTANKIATDEKTGITQMEGAAIIRDSTNGYIVTANIIFLNKKNNSFLAYKKPVLIVIDKKDSTYIAGDTLFSGITKRTFKDTTTNDSLKTVSAKDSAHIIKDSINIAVAKADSKMDTLRKTKTVNLNNTDSTVRFFQAFNHVRIFNDSLQSICDSLYYSGEDSIFRLYRNPVLWSNKSQVTGDTIFLYTKNKKAQRLYVFENGMVVNKTNKEFYNQMAGKTINGYFKDGEIDYMRVRGSKAESIHFIQDEKDSSFVGMNRATGDVIDLYFINHSLNKVKFVNDIHGKMYPMRQATQDVRYLKNFIWLEDKRPKNKLELFE